MYISGGCIYSYYATIWAIFKSLAMKSIAVNSSHPLVIHKYSIKFNYSESSEERSDSLQQPSDMEQLDNL